MELEQMLRSHLFSSYDPNVKPNAEMPDSEIKILLDLMLDQVLDLTIKQESLRVRMTIHHEWNDPRLYWEHLPHFKNITYIRTKYDQVWNPEIILHNNQDGNYYPESFSDFQLTVYSNGTIIYSPAGIFVSHCNINVRDFPYDEQICAMYLTSMVYSSSVVKFEPRFKYMHTRTTIPNQEWDLVNSKIEEITRYDVMSYTNETFIKCSVHLVRKPLFYTIYILLPTIAVTSMVISVFHLPNMGGEKITLSISVLLALTFFLNLVSGLTPRTSTDIPLVSKYLMFSMVLVSLSVICSVCIANVHHRTPEIHTMPDWLHKIFLQTLPSVLLMKKPVVPKPIFPVGHRFSISGEYPHQYNQHIPQPEAPRKENRPLELDDEQIRMVSGRNQLKTETKRIKFLSREDTIFQSGRTTSSSEDVSLSSNTSSSVR